MSTVKSICRFGNFEHAGNELGYCERHKRKYLYEVGVKEGKKFCRFYVRGCDNLVTDDKKTCNSCLVKKYADNPPCAHDGCTNNSTNDTIYCGIHHKNIYYDKQRIEGITYCNIERGCYNIIDGTTKSCRECLDVRKQADTKRIEQNKIESEKIKKEDETKRACYKCKSIYTVFKTQRGEESTKCQACYNKQREIEQSRAPRNRIIVNPEPNHRRWTTEKFYELACSNDLSEFYEYNKNVLTEEELETYRQELIAMNVSDATKSLKTFLNKLNVRRRRFKAKNGDKESDD
jgi:hypothetical protein